MAPTNSGKRLDQILLELGCINEAQIKEALLRQKAHGGKFGSQLVYFRYIDEVDLVRALEIQFGCEGVRLSKIAIDDVVLKLIPEKIAIARRILPFDYDINANVLKIACADPSDQNLINELKFVARGKDVKLYIAAEISLDAAIARYYLGQDTSLDNQLLLEIPDITLDEQEIDDQQDETDDVPDISYRKVVLLLTDEAYAGPLIQSILEREDYEVFLTDSIYEATEIIGRKNIHALLLNDRIPGDYFGLVDRVRRLSSKTIIRYYDSFGSLLLGQGERSIGSDLLIKNLDILTSLLTTTSGQAVNYGGRIGKYAVRLCRRMHLPEKELMIIGNAAYIYNIAAYYYGAGHEKDSRERISQTVKLLESLDFSPVVIAMLRAMYIDISGKYENRLPIEILGGNILTVVDLYCGNAPTDEVISIDRFDEIKKKLRARSGKLFLPEVLEHFIDMIQAEILDCHTTPSSGQVMIYSDDALYGQTLDLRIRNEGYRTVIADSEESMVDLYNRSEPDVVVVVRSQNPDDTKQFIAGLTDNGIDLAQTPFFILVDSSRLSDLTGLLNDGVEDLIALGDNLDMLISKIHKVISKKSERGANEGGKQAGARGSLSEMNLIDLLQALGPSLKTVKIEVQTGGDDSNSLVIYLNRGHIEYAELGGLSGPDAVYESMTWSDGKWVVKPVDEKAIPPANNDQTNESILMEGCRLIDEKLRSGKLL